ncbi:hypothetical protein, partial [Pseudomonas helleri]
QVTSVTTTAKLVALARNAPCLAHTKKRHAGVVRLYIFGLPSPVAGFTATRERYPDKGGMSTMFSVGRIEM